MSTSCTEDDGVKTVLAEPITLNDLQDGLVITVDSFETCLEGITNDLDESGSDYNEDYFSIGKDKAGKDLRGNPGEDLFETFAENMTVVGGDTRVQKRILREGTLNEGVPEDAVVTVSYNAYLELGKTPFDSTFLIGKPSRFSLLDCVEGLAIGIGSMRKTERAQILLHPDVAYGEQGVPPRIPANSKILYEIELIDFEMKDDPATAVSKMGFKGIMSESNSLYKEACDYFKNGDVYGAQQRFQKVLRKMERMRLANEEEEIEQEKLLLKLYISLAVCFNKQKKAPQACNMCKCALKIQRNHAKALFNFGRALFILNDYEEAQKKLYRALKVEPNSNEILDEIEKVKAKQKEYMDNQAVFAKRMFS